MAKRARTVRKKREHVDAQGQAHIKSTFNNTNVTLTDQNGNVISWATAGKVGFKGSRKNTPFAAQLAAETAAKEAMEVGLRKIDVEVKGPGGGREAAIQTHAESNGFSVVRELVGHGVGKDLHEDPQVPNYGVAGRGPLLKSGITLAIEPMINYGNKNIHQIAHPQL